MALDDITVIAVLVTSAFFVALSLGLLVRYRQASQRISASTDLGKDLWQALEQRLDKQDERVLDMMGRMEVLQARVMANPSLVQQPARSPVVSPEPTRTTDSGASDVTGSSVHQVNESQDITVPRFESQATLDDTQRKAIALLKEKAMNTREITKAMGLSREHTARIMKRLFEWGLVIRDDSSKPFVYQLTDSARKYV